MSTGSGLTRGQMLVWALPNLALSLLFAPASAILPNLYAKTTAITLGAIGAVMVGMRVFDAVLDQVVGYLSDRTNTRWGARLPWMVAGTPLLMIAGYCLYTPPPSADLWYFGLWSAAFYTAWTFLNIPFLAWGSELTADYRERSVLFAWYGAMSQVGGFLFFSAPVVLAALGLTKTSDFGEEQMRIVALVSACALPVLVGLSAWRSPRSPAQSGPRPDVRGVLQSFVRNVPLRLFILVYVISVLGTGTFAAAIILYLDGYLGLGEKLPWILIGMAAIAVVTIYPWTFVVKRYGKHKPWAITWVMSACILPLLAFVEPGSPHVFEWTLAILFAYALVEALTNFLPGAVLADVVDYERLRSGVDRAGNFYAFHNLVIKSAAAIGGGAGYLLLDWCGYDVKNPAASGPFAIAGLMLTALVFPSLMKLAGAAIMWRFPIDERRQGVIRRRLEQRAARQARAAPSTLASAVPEPAS